MKFTPQSDWIRCEGLWKVIIMERFYLPSGMRLVPIQNRSGEFICQTFHDGKTHRRCYFLGKTQSASKCLYLRLPKTVMNTFMNYPALKSFVIAFQVPRNLYDKDTTCFFLKFNIFFFWFWYYSRSTIRARRVFENRSSNAFLTSCFLTPLVFQMPPQYVALYISWLKTHKTPKALLYIWEKNVCLLTISKLSWKLCLTVITKWSQINDEKGRNKSP